MKPIFMNLFLAACAIVMTASLAMAALTVEAAKSQGLVGERVDGTLGVVVANGEANALVQTVNSERLATYKQIASKNGTSVDVVQAAAGKKLIGSAKSGEYVQGADGSWHKK